MSSHVIGTAGHIDHGKSTLVKALTGIDPDRLKEEKEREMTIDLGFAYLDLPSGKRVGVVDVPGHERFIRNMLAGASGIDVVLFVVAADEGMMPQSREHLDILNLLGVKHGVIVLTKVDLVDEEWLYLVEEEIREEVKGTFLEGAPIFRVSSVRGTGLKELVSYLDSHLNRIGSRPVDLPARYPIDRVFKKAGFGTIVTGTLWEGRISIGQILELLPQGVEVKVRHLQSHGLSVESAEAAVRLAVNISGAEKVSVERGCVLAEPGYYRPTKMIDAELTVLKSAHPVRHAEKVHFYLGTKETLGKVRILDGETIEPGETRFVQIILEEPVVARRGDRFIVRRFSPVITIGGGIVLEPYAQRKRLNDTQHREELELKKRGDLSKLLIHYLNQHSFSGLTLEEMKYILAEKEEKIAELLGKLKSEGKAVQIKDSFFSMQSLEMLKEKVISSVRSYLDKNPHLPYVDKELLRSQIGMKDKWVFNHVLEEMAIKGILAVLQEGVSLPDRKVELTPVEAEIRDRIESIFLQAKVSTPEPEQIFLQFEGKEKVAKKMFDLLVRENRLVKISPDFYLHADVLEDVKNLLRKEFQRKERLKMSEIRDALQTSRKYAVPLAEYLDKIKFTRRIGDERVLLDY